MARRTNLELLAQGRKYRFMVTRWFSNETFSECVKKEAHRLSKGKKPTLSQWVKAAGSAIYPCDHCDGSGEYRWGPCINGRPPQYGGPCYRCEGKGKMDPSDCARTAEYHNHLKVV